MAQAISKKGWLAACLENTALTLATEAKALFIPCKAVMTGTQHYEYLDEERNTVDTPNERQATVREGKTDPKGSFYVDTSALFLFGLTGTPTSTQPDSGGNPTVWKHTFNLSDIPPTLSMWKSYHQVTYYASGVAVEKVVLKWSSNKLLEIDVNTKHLWPTKYTAATLSPSYSTVKPFAGYAPTITTSAGASSDIDEMTITLERECKPWYPSSGTQDFTRWDYGKRKASIEFQARFDNDTLYNLFRASTDDSLTVLFQGATISNTYKQELSLTFGTVGYDSMEHDTGKDNVMIKAKGMVRPTAGVLFSGWVQNAKTGTNYAAS
jgi:hypothetical protein